MPPHPPHRPAPSFGNPAVTVRSPNSTLTMFSCIIFPPDKQRHQCAPDKFLMQASAVPEIALSASVPSASQIL